MLLLLLILGAGSAVGAAFLERRFERDLPLTLFSIIFALYCFGLFDALFAGAIFVTVCAALAWTFAVVRLIRKRAWRAFFRNLFTPAFCIYLALFLFACVFNYGRKVSSWDDLTHWGDVVRQMSLLHKFGASREATVMFPNYPPAMALVQYLVQMLNGWTTGEAFSEWLLFATHLSVLYALFMPFLSKLRYKSWFCNLCLLGIIIALPGILNRGMYRLLEIDSFLGTLAGFGLAMAATADFRDLRDTATFLLCVFVLSITKSVGVVFSAGLVIALCAVLFLRKTPMLPQGKRGLLLPVFSVGFGLFGWFTWRAYLSANQTYHAFSQSVDWSVLWRVLTGADGSYRQEVWSQFLKEFFAPEFTTGILNFGMSFAAAVLALGVFSAVFLRLHRRDSCASRQTVVVVTGFFIMLLFAFGMGVSYLFSFSEREARLLDCYDRYMGIPLLMLEAMLFCCCTASMENGRFRHPYLAAALLLPLLLVAPIQEVGGFMLGRNAAFSENLRMPVDTVVADVTPKLDNTKAQKINVVSAGSNGLDFLMFRFAMRPHQISIGWKLGPTFDNNPKHIWAVQPENGLQWRQRLLEEGDSYVLVYRIDDAFRSAYADAFVAGTPITDNTLYAVDPDSGMLSLIG